MTDRAFWKSFAGLIATLMAVAVALFVVAQIIGKSAKTTEATADAKAVAERIKPVGELAVGAVAARKVAQDSTNSFFDPLIPSGKAAAGDNV